MLFAHISPSFQPPYHKHPRLVRLSLIGRLIDKMMLLCYRKSTAIDPAKSFVTVLPPSANRKPRLALLGVRHLGLFESNVFLHAARPEAFLSFCFGLIQE
jgi:hypothetical protein